MLTPKLPARLGAEFLGTFWLVFAGCGSAIFAAYIWSGRGVLQPERMPQRFRWALSRGVLKIGALSSIVSTTTNLAIAIATALVGVYGSAAVAGFGTAVRLEYLLVPLVFGLGTPVASMRVGCICSLCTGARRWCFASTKPWPAYCHW